MAPLPAAALADAIVAVAGAGAAMRAEVARSYAGNRHRLGVAASVPSVLAAYERARAR